MERARDELFSHVIRCDVLEASMDDRHEWLDETMDYMAHRHPHLSELQIAQLEVLGRRFIKPAIPHGSGKTELNRDSWQKTPGEELVVETASEEVQEMEVVGAAM